MPNQQSDIRYDLHTGEVTVPTRREIQHEEYMTAMLRNSLGDCDNECHYIEPYGWVPECGCPIHDAETPSPE